MRVVFMGTPEFAVPSLKVLMEYHEVVAVVTQPDKPRGRGNQVSHTPVKEAALEKGITVLQPERLRNFHLQLKEFGADIFVVAAYGRKLPERVLNLPPMGCVNVHASLLPKYRGAAPIQWSVIDGEQTTGITIMQMDKGIDTGDIMLQKEIAIDNEDTGGSLHDKLSVLGAEALAETLELLQAGRAVRVPQDGELSTYAKMLTKEMGKIDFGKGTKEIVNLIRGLNPWPVAYAIYNGAPLKIYRAEEVFTSINGHVGEIISLDGGIIIKTGDGAVRLTEVQALNGKRMIATDYLRGHKMKIYQTFA